MSENKEVKKQRNLTIRLDDELEAAIKERIEYLQKQTPYTKVTQTMAVRHAILHKGYRKNRNGEDK